MTEDITRGLDETLSQDSPSGGDRGADFDGGLFLAQATTMPEGQGVSEDSEQAGTTGEGAAAAEDAATAEDAAAAEDSAAAEDAAAAEDEQAEEVAEEEAEDAEEEEVVEAESGARVSTEEATAEGVTVDRPLPGQTVELSPEAGQLYLINFDPTTAQVVIEGRNFVLVFGDGGRIVFQNLVGLAQSGSAPVLQVGGVNIGGDLILSQATALAQADQRPSLETTVETAAGPQVPGGGANVYSDDLGTLIPVLEALGPIPFVELTFGLIDIPVIDPPVLEAAALPSVLIGPAPVVTISDAEAIEGQPLVFMIQLDIPSGEDIVLDLMTTSGTATDGVDYENASFEFSVDGGLTYQPAGGPNGTQVTVPATVTKIFVRIDTLQDSLDEPNETMTLKVAQVITGDVDDSSDTSTGTIIDDDGPPSLIIGDAQAIEGRPLVFSVGLSTVGARDIVLDLRTVGGTATDGVDYENFGFEYSVDDGATFLPAGGPNGTEVTIPAGSSGILVRIETNQDSLDEPDETMTLVVDSVISGEVGDVSDSGTGTIIDDDAGPNDPNPAISPAVAFEGDPLVFTVSLSSPSGGDVVLELTTRGVTATDGVDYENGGFEYSTDGGATFIPAGGPNGTFVTIPAGQSGILVRIDTAIDSVVDPNETMVLAIANVVAGDVGDISDIGTGLILEREIDLGPDPVVSIGNAEAVEGQPLVFTVSLDIVSAGAIVLDLKTIGGSATDGVDYENMNFEYSTDGGATFQAAAGPNGTQVTIPAGQRDILVRVDTLQDSIDEPNETMTLAVDSVVSGDVDDFSDTGTGTIIDDDGPPSVIIGDARALEGNPLVFSVALSSPATTTVVLDLATSGITATDGVDYENASFEYSVDNGATFVAAGGPNGTQVTIPAGASGVLVRVDTIEDTLDEPDETMTLRVNSVISGSVGDTSDTGRGTIVDDDPGPNDPNPAISPAVAFEGDPLVFNLTLSSTSTSDIVLELQTSGVTATDGVDYENGGFEYSTDGGATFQAAAGPNGTVVTIPAGQSGILVRIDTAVDSIVDPNETMTLGIANVVAGSLGDISDIGTGLILERPIDIGPDPVVSIGDAQAIEGQPLVFTVSLDIASAGAIVLDLKTIGGSATDGVDYENMNFEYSTDGGATFLAAGGPNGSQVTIPAGQREIQVRIDTLQDSIDEPNETMILAVDSVVSGDVDDFSDTGTGTIIDDDGPPSVIIGDARADEGDPLLFSIALSSPPAAPVVLDLATSGITATDGVDYENANFEFSTDGGFTFAAAGGPNGTQVTIPAGSNGILVRIDTIEDLLDEPDETMTLRVDSVVSGSVGDTSDTGRGTILDDDPGPSDPDPAISPAVAFEGDPLVFDLTLSSASAADVVVELETTGITATDGVDYENFGFEYSTDGGATFIPAGGPNGTQVTIPAGQTAILVRIDTFVDDVTELPEFMTLSIASVISGSLGDISDTATGTILDRGVPPPEVTLAVGGDGFLREDVAETVTIGATVADATDRLVSITLSGLPAGSAFDLTALQNDPRVIGFNPDGNGIDVPLTLQLDPNLNLQTFSGTFVLTAPADSDVDLAAVVTSVSEDIATGQRSIPSQGSEQFAIVVDATLDQQANVTQSTVPSGSESSAVQTFDLGLSFNLVNAGFAGSGAGGPDDDGSESVTSARVEISAGTLSLASAVGSVTLTQIGQTPGGGTVYALAGYADSGELAAAVEALQITVPANFTGNVTGRVLTTTAEANTPAGTVPASGAEPDISNNVRDGEFAFSVSIEGGGEPPEVDLRVGGRGFLKEDVPETITISATVADASDKLVTVSLSGLPAGAVVDLTALTSNPNVIGFNADGNGKDIPLVLQLNPNANLQTFSGNFVLTAPADSDVDLQGIVVGSTAVDIASAETSAPGSRSFDVAVDAVLDQAPDIDQAGVPMVQQSSSPNTVGLGLDFSVVSAGFADSLQGGPDGDGSESITSVRITLSAGSLQLGATPGGTTLTLESGTPPAASTWVLSGFAGAGQLETAVESLSVIVPPSFAGTINGQVLTVAVEANTPQGAAPASGLEPDTADNVRNGSFAFQVQVQTTPNPPEVDLTVAGDGFLKEDTPNTITISATAADASDRLLTVSLSGLPAGAILDLGGLINHPNVISVNPGGNGKDVPLVLTLNPAANLGSFVGSFTAQAPLDSDVDFSGVAVSSVAQDIPTGVQSPVGSETFTVVVDAVVDGSEVLLNGAIIDPSTVVSGQQGAAVDLNLSLQRGLDSTRSDNTPPPPDPDSDPSQGGNDGSIAPDVTEQVSQVRVTLTQANLQFGLATLVFMMLPAEIALSQPVPGSYVFDTSQASDSQVEALVASFQIQPPAGFSGNIGLRIDTTTVEDNTPPSTPGSTVPASGVEADVSDNVDLDSYQFTVQIAANLPPTVQTTSGDVEAMNISLSIEHNPTGVPAGNYLLDDSIPDGISIDTTAFVPQGVDPRNLTLSADTEVTVQFVRENAGEFSNMVGWYTFDSNGNINPSSVRFLWLDLSAPDPMAFQNLLPDILGNDQPEMISLGQLAAGTRIGFFMISNGAEQPFNVQAMTEIAGAASGYQAAIDAINAQTSLQIDGNGNGRIAVDVNGDLRVLQGDTFFTHDINLNSDGAPGSDIQHTLSGVTVDPVTGDNDGFIYIGFEDQPQGGDRDFNDGVFRVDIGPASLNELATASFMPVTTVDDPDNMTIVSAVVTTSMFEDDDDLLIDPDGTLDPAFLAGFNIVQGPDGSGNPTITITGTASDADYSLLLSTITFRSSESAVEGPRQITFQVTDDQGLVSNPATSVINVSVHDVVSTSVIVAENGNAFTFSTGSGDDTVVVSAEKLNANQFVDGGSGFDTLQVGAADQVLTTDDIGQFSNFEVINLGAFQTGGFDFDANTVSLRVQDVVDLASNNELDIFGTSEDDVNLIQDTSETWQLVGTSGGILTYQGTTASSETVTVRISDEVSVDVM